MIRNLTLSDAFFVIYAVLTRTWEKGKTEIETSFSVALKGREGILRMIAF